MYTSQIVGQVTGASRDSNLADCLVFFDMFDFEALCMASPRSLSVNRKSHSTLEHISMLGEADWQTCKHINNRRGSAGMITLAFVSLTSKSFSSLRSAIKQTFPDTKCGDNAGCNKNSFKFQHVLLHLLYYRNAYLRHFVLAHMHFEWYVQHVVFVHLYFACYFKHIILYLSTCVFTGYVQHVVLVQLCFACCETSILCISHAMCTMLSLSTYVSHAMYSMLYLSTGS